MKKTIKEKDTVISNLDKTVKDLNDKLNKTVAQYEKAKNLINTRENLYLKNQLKGQLSKAQKVNNENIKKENELINKIAKQNKIEVIRNNAVNYTKKKK